MSRAPSTFKQRDVTAALKAAAAAGVKLKRIEIAQDGKIVLITGDGECAITPDTDLDRELADWEARRGR